MADNWEIFVRLHLKKVVRVVLHTPLYNFIVEKFPIQFITKLISTVRSSADNTTIISAAAMIQDIAGTTVFRQALNSPTTTVRNKKFLRRRALSFMLNGKGIIAVQECGKVLASKLLRSSLENGVIWREFLELAQQGFYHVAEYAPKSSLLDIICDQPHTVARVFMNLLEPSMREKYTLFFAMMIVLLREASDHRPYRILAYVCGLLDDEQWSTLMEEAIMSSFFNGAHSSWSRFLAASSLRFCIDNGPEIHYELYAICKLHTIILGLRKSREHVERLVAVELYEAFARRILRAPIPPRRPQTILISDSAAPLDALYEVAESEKNNIRGTVLDIIFFRL